MKHKKRKEEPCKNIISSARKFFLSKSLYKGTLEEIGRDTGIFIDTGFHHISLKDELSFEILRESYDSFRVLYENIDENHPTFVLQNLVTQTLELFVASLQLTKLVLHALPKLDELLKERLLRFIVEWHVLILQRIFKCFGYSKPKPFTLLFKVMLDRLSLMLGFKQAILTRK